MRGTANSVRYSRRRPALIFLVHLLRWFSLFFGISVAPPDQERKWAVYLACVLGVMMVVGIGAIVLLFKFGA